MGKMIAGTFNGTGAALYIGIGFIPDWVKLRNMDDTVNSSVEWNKHMNRCPEHPEGWLLYTNTTLTPTEKTFGTCIRPYHGGDTMTAASTAYLVKDDANYAYSTTYGQIDTWTLDTAGTPTGHFNLEADTTYVGVGSQITIDGYTYGITAITSNGEQTDEVTLSEAAATGSIEYISRMYDYAGAAKGAIIPAGFKISATDVINVSGEMCYFEAGMYDN